MTLKQQVVENLLKNWEYLLPILTGLIAALGHWRKTGHLPLGRLPLRALRQAWRGISTKYFAKPRPKNVPALLIDATPEEIDKKLRPIHFESADLYSLEYEDEVLNLRRPDGYFQAKDGDTFPSELHGRWFRTADGRLLCLAHHEASRFEAWNAHLDRTIFSWKRGQKKMSAVLSGRGIKHEQIESEKVAGVEVVNV